MPEPLPTSLPFDPNPRKPRWQLPSDACDTHFHVFGPPSRFPYAVTRRYEPPAAPIEHYNAMQRIVGLTRGVVVQPTAHGTDNAALLDAVARSQGRLRGIACFDETTSDEELRRLAAGGVVGARFSLMSDRAGGRRAIETALPRLHALGWSLDLHIEPEKLVTHADFVRSFPITTVIDHVARIGSRKGIGHPAFALLVELLQHGRFWTKICCFDKLSAERATTADNGIPYRDMIPLARTVIEAAPERVIWGSDWPHGNTFELGTIPNDGALLDLLGEIAPDDETRRRILVENPARLYGFS